ncbi:motility associated factor glycosyltransferase family protein [Pseudoalteromonas aurantia]|uniref:Septum formation inhibitor Maf n=1 Tax=Pseudoalteromonas aurantia TaxID=43654 RepID=A0A5S3VBQ3_9GAMM|nr:6-hydroxymethylpterin diphosphokinase MptE-like protein [Pseudoalteromonas aurantia]TMO69480.1 septum formation inhibitor Maf [Pseudoalteromonas aurantia]
MTLNDNSDLNKVLQEAEDKLSLVQQQNDREQVFAEQANTRFERNMSAFRKYYPDIAHSIENYKTRQDFCLHVTQSGHGNFFPGGGKLPLYNDDPTAQAKEQVDHYTENANFGRTNYFNSSAWESDDERIHVRYMLKLVNVLSEANGKGGKRMDYLPAHFPSAMVFGIGLGYHLDELLSRHKFDYLFICEPDLELFFASLFCIDWATIIETIDDEGGCLFLNIGVEYEDFFNEIFKITEDIGIFSVINSFCYQHYPSDEITALIKTFFENYYQLHQGFGFYNDAITGLAHAILNVEQGAHFLYPKPSGKELASQLPVFVVGNGPSLDASIDILLEYQDDAVIIAGGTAYQSLMKAGVKVDFHVLVERTQATYDVQKHIAPEGEYKDTNLLSVDVMYPDVPGLYKWTGIGLKGPEAASAFISIETLKKYGLGVASLPACGPLVSNTAAAYAVTMGFEDIYLIGIDNGYTLSGNTHSTYSIYHDDDLKSSFKAIKGAHIKLPGNFDDDVLATPLLALSKSMFDRLAHSATNSRIYNVGHGAKIRDTISLLEDQVIIDPFKNDKAQLVEGLKNHHFNKIALDNIEQIIGLESFNELCDYLIEIGMRPYSTREEANELLMAQQKVVYAYRKSAQPHFFHLIKGTLLYFHCPLMTMLYFFENEKETVIHFKEGFDIWLEFLKEIKEDFTQNWRKKCDFTLPEYRS